MQQPSVTAWGESGASSSISPISRTYYDVRGATIATENHLGARPRRFYDAAGQLIEERNAMNGVTRHVYDGLGREVRRMLANGRVMDTGYDKLDRAIWQETQGYDVRRFDFYVYDESGNRIGERRGIRGSGNAGGSGTGGEYTRYHYDTKGRLVQLLTPLADAGTSADAFKTTYTYDAQDRKLTERNGLGITQSWTYDYFSRVLTYADLAGVTTTYGYDTYGRLSTASNSGISQTVVNGTSAVNTHGQSFEYGYYENGRLKSVRDVARGVRTYHEYDLAGNRTLERTLPESTKNPYQDTRLTYDAIGRLIRAADARYRVDYGYDAVGNRRVTRSESLSGFSGAYSGTYTRDGVIEIVTITINGHGLATGDKVKLDFTSGAVAAGDYVVTVQDANRFTVQSSNAGVTSGNVILRGRVKEYWYTYDGDNRITLAQGVRSGGAINYTTAQGAALEYDGTGNRTKTTQYESSVKVYRRHDYDPSNRISTSYYDTDSTSELVTTQRTYDNLGRITEYIDKGSTGTATASRRTVTYDANGRMRQQEYWTPAAGGSWTNTVDVNYKDANNNSWYDAAGNLLQYQVAGVSGTTYTQTYVYRYLRFGGGYREREIYGSGQAGAGGFMPGSTTTAYDVNGNTAWIAQTGQATRTFVTDSQGQILRKTQNAHTVSSRWT